MMTMYPENPEPDAEPEPEQDYWFRPMKYGWGWGLPRNWQGWVFLTSWLVIFFAGTFGALLLMSKPILSILVLNIWSPFMCVILIAVCMWKGPPPRWRWGD